MYIAMDMGTSNTRVWLCDDQKILCNKKMTKNLKMVVNLTLFATNLKFSIDFPAKRWYDINVCFRNFAISF